MKTLAAIFALAFSTAQAASPLVRPAPDFVFSGVGGAKSLRALRGQPVVLLVAKNPQSRAFRKQVKAIEDVYRELASRNAVFAVAFSESGDGVSSNVPFVVVSNGAAVARSYGLTGDFMLGVVGPDGNLDLATGEVTRGLRIREVILNTFNIQTAARREKPKGRPE
jgi:hypothetical protein